MALNAYAHLTVRNLPGTVVDDDEFIDAIWGELPDASLGTGGGVLELTVSQFALTNRGIARRQTGRVARALNAAGVSNPQITVDEIVRSDVRDDLRAIAGMVRWHARRAAKKAIGGR